VVSAAPFRLVLIHRMAHGLRGRGVRVVPNVLRAWGQFVWGADIWPGATISSRFRITHPNGIVVGNSVIAGSDLVRFPGVVLGSSAKVRGDWDSNQPRLGDRVLVSSHAVIAGAVEVGDDFVIGANVVVLHDVPVKHIVRSAEPIVEPCQPHRSIAEDSTPN
jgi:serine O-acetyltransferase